MTAITLNIIGILISVGFIIYNIVVNQYWLVTIMTFWLLFNGTLLLINLGLIKW